MYGALALVALGLIVALFQSPINGTHRWIAAAVVPSCSRRSSRSRRSFSSSRRSSRGAKSGSTTSPATLLPVGFILALFAGLILLGRDFGTATTLMLVAAGMIFAAGLSWRYIALLSLALVPAGAYFAVSAAYRRERLLTFLNPEARSAGRGVPADAVADRARHGRLRRPRHRQRPAEALLPSRAAHRFHLLDHRRGARLPRRGAAAGRVRVARVARLPDRALQRRAVSRSTRPSAAR